jgi:ribulose-5-phosphate 4-epimerase/fuculose-1-phosphate aldolase
MEVGWKPAETPIVDHATGEVMPTTDEWARPCADYTSHRDSHRNRPEGWVCIACHPAVAETSS